MGKIILIKGFLLFCGTLFTDITLYSTDPALKSGIVVFKEKFCTFASPNVLWLIRDPFRPILEYACTEKSKGLPILFWLSAALIG